MVCAGYTAVVLQSLLLHLCAKQRELVSGWCVYTPGAVAATVGILVPAEGALSWIVNSSSTILIVVLK
jgi:hypothetical protein